VNDVSAIVGVRGFGLPCARRLGLGRRLLLGDVSVVILEESRSALESEGYDVKACVVDVSSRDSVAAFAAEAKAMGRLANFVVTAGLSPQAASPERILSVNLLGTEYVKEAFEPQLTQGSVGVVFASNAAYYSPVPREIERDFALLPSDKLIDTAKKVQGWDNGMGAYWLAKRCNQLRVESAAPRWGRLGARIVSISPGIFSTAMAHAEQKMGSPIIETANATPMARLGNANEMGSLVEWVTGPAAGYLTGSDILMDGGYMAAARWGDIIPPGVTGAGQQ